MSLCRLMVEDFMHQTGRYFKDGELAYTDNNLRFGIEFAEWLLEEGYRIEPFYRYNLDEFIRWACSRLEGQTKGGNVND